MFPYRELRRSCTAHQVSIYRLVNLYSVSCDLSAISVGNGTDQSRPVPTEMCRRRPAQNGTGPIATSEMSFTELVSYNVKNYIPNILIS